MSTDQIILQGLIELYEMYERWLDRAPGDEATRRKRDAVGDKMNAVRARMGKT